MRPLLAFLSLALLAEASAQVQTLEPVSVSATRSPEPVSEVPFGVGIVPAEAFDLPASPTVDGVLGGEADFSLFRRNDSMTANPTSQGVSLRGLGPSGASRSLVLLDGVPLNDPFGGWVPWSLVPVDSLSGAEIVPGGGAAAWGNAALAGVIELFSKEPAPGSGAVLGRFEDFGTALVDFSQAFSAGPGTLEVRGESLSSGGTLLVAPQNRGSVDGDAASRHNLASARWRGRVGRGAGLVVTLRDYDEWRDNGTPYQQNRLRLLLMSAVLSGSASPEWTWSATAYAQSQGSSQTFSSVNAARSAETPASDQFAVPASAVGLAWTSTLSDRSGGSTTLGADVRDVGGETREDYLFSNGAYEDRRYAGGRQSFEGLFAERSQPLWKGAHATLGARLDRWEDSDGHMRESSIATGSLILDSLYPNRTGTELSPSAGLVWDAGGGLRFHAAAQHAFRQPTLNELYRPFRQGNTTTLANAGLSTEHADTGEAGATWSCGASTLSLTGFAARLDDPVANVTLAQGPGTFPLFGSLPAGSTGQERLNLGRVDIHGFQLGAKWEASRTLSLEVSAVGESTAVEAAPVEPDLVGKALPEVPRWNSSLGLAWRPTASLSLSLRARWSSSEFDDDLNQLPLASYCSVDASLRYAFAKHAEVFATVENAGDSRIETAHSSLGVYNLAPPRTAGVGARVSW